MEVAWKHIDEFTSICKEDGLHNDLAEDFFRNCGDALKKSAFDRHKQLLIETSLQRQSSGLRPCNLRAIGVYEVYMKTWATTDTRFSRTVGPWTNATMGKSPFQCLLCWLPAHRTADKEETVGFVKLTHPERSEEDAFPLKPQQIVGTNPGSKIEIQMKEQYQSAIFQMAAQRTWLTIDEYLERCSSTLHVIDQSSESYRQRLNSVKQTLTEAMCTETGEEMGSFHADFRVHGMGYFWDDTKESYRSEEHINWHGKTIVAHIDCCCTVRLTNSDVVGRLAHENGQKDEFYFGGTGFCIDKGMRRHIELDDKMDGAIFVKLSYRPKTKDDVEKERTCSVCGITREASMTRCSRCKGVRYCSQACQRKDWPSHKKVCKKAT